MSTPLSLVLDSSIRAIRTFARRCASSFRCFATRGSSSFSGAADTGGSFPRSPQTKRRELALELRTSSDTSGPRPPPAALPKALLLRRVRACEEAAMQPIQRAVRRCELPLDAVLRKYVAE